MQYNFPELPIEEQEEKEYLCKYCGGEIYNGGRAFLVDDGLIHIDCLIPMLEDRIGLEGIAHEFGFDRVIVNG